MLEVFGRAIAREAHNLNLWPELVWQQLYNRLRWQGDSIAGGLRSEAEQRTRGKGAPWLSVRGPFRESESLRLTLAGHAHWVNACAVSPDGTFIVSASEDRSLKIWDAATGEMRRTLSSPVEFQKTCAVSPDGTFIVSGGEGPLRVWDAATGEQRQTITYQVISGGGILGCAVSPDGDFMVALNSDGLVRIFDCATGELRRELGSFNELRTRHACAVSPDASFIVAASGDRTLTVWDAATGEERLTFEGHAPEVRAGAVSGLDLPSGFYPSPTDMVPAKIRACAVSADGTFIVSSGDDTTLRIWDAKTGRERLTLAGHSMSVQACAVSPDGTFVVSASDDGSLKLWETSSGRELGTLAGHGGQVRGCAVSPDGTFVVSSSFDWTLKIWEVESAKQPSPAQDVSRGAGSCAVSPDGSFVVWGTSTGLKIWDTATGEERRTLGGEAGACAVGPDASFIVSAGGEKLKVWDVATGEERLTLSGHTGWVTACAVSPDGSFIVSVGAIPEGRDGLKVWDSLTGRDIRSLQAGWSMKACAVTPDGSSVLAGITADQNLFMWDAATGEVRLSWAAHASRSAKWTDACAVSPDGSFIVSAGGLDELKIWDAVGGEERHQLVGHTSYVRHCAVSPDGRLIVSASYDDTVRLWDAATGAAVAGIPLPGRPSCIALHPFTPLIVCADTALNFHFLGLEGIEYGPIVVSAIQRDERRTVRCPKCWQAHELEEAWLGQEIDCPATACDLRLRVNPFVVARPDWLSRGAEAVRAVADSGHSIPAGGALRRLFRRRGGGADVPSGEP